MHSNENLSKFQNAVNWEAFVNEKFRFVCHSKVLISESNLVHLRFFEAIPYFEIMGINIEYAERAEIRKEVKSWLNHCCWGKEQAWLSLAEQICHREWSISLEKGPYFKNQWSEQNHEWRVLLEKESTMLMLNLISLNIQWLNLITLRG